MEAGGRVIGVVMINVNAMNGDDEVTKYVRIKMRSKIR